MMGEFPETFSLLRLELALRCDGGRGTESRAVGTGGHGPPSFSMDFSNFLKKDFIRVIHYLCGLCVCHTVSFLLLPEMAGNGVFTPLFLKISSGDAREIQPGEENPGSPPGTQLAPPHLNTFRGPGISASATSVVVIYLRSTCCAVRPIR